MRPSADEVLDQIVESATAFTYKISILCQMITVCRLLKSHDLISAPAYIVVKAAEEFRGKTTAPNPVWQTDFTYPKAITEAGFTCQPPSVMTRVISLAGIFVVQ